MKIAYFDCFSGASGDMILGALLAAGVSETDFRARLGKLGVGGYELDIRAIRKQGFAATKVDVHVAEQAGHRHLHHITKILKDSTLSATEKDRAIRIFTRLAEAEASVHGSTVEQVHFHEVGAVDAIVDVVGAVIGLELLGVQRIVCSPIPVGSGAVKCHHGVMPVPAPATAELLRGVPLAACDEPGELTTPTGAALLTTLADAFGPVPDMTIRSIGYGAGSRDGQTRPNLLRLLIGVSGGSAADAERVDEIVVLETNLDDATGQQVSHALDALFAAGALDVFTTAIHMKKNRPGMLLTVLAPVDRVFACEEVLFTHTPTFGIRRHTCTRTKLERRIETVDTRFGPVPVKVGMWAGRVLTVTPEHDACVHLAAKCGVLLRDIYFAAQQAGRARYGLDK